MKFLALANGATQRAYETHSNERIAKCLIHESGLGDVDKKFQSILQKKIIRLAFFGSFFGSEKKEQNNIIKIKLLLQTRHNESHGLQP
ncbi:MAG: hypothetical protein GZ086_14440 [Gelidibacter sp.]|nr:hypothetical protein [Gelidibacter sp.]